MKFLGSFLMAFCFLVNGAQAEPLSLTSDSRKTTLIEIFSSEGCSSCPPAEAWASSLTHNSGLWRDFVPVIFHVDYWDYLGWKDRFASPAYTQRQHDYAKVWHESTVYTPGVVANGSLWRAWHRTNGIPSENESPGILKIVELKAGRYQVSFEPQNNFKNGKMHAALLGFGIDVDVTRGENAGETLRHDFTVLDFQSLPLRASPFSVIFDLNPKKFQAARLGIAAWVTESDNTKPVQAVGGYLS